ncbi:MAG: EamA family transporter [Halobaculum sp.]
METLAAPPVVYLLALTPAVLWGLAPILSKRGMAAGGSPVQASVTVVVVDSTLYWLALGALALVTGRVPFAGLTPFVIAVFLGAGVVGTALGRLAVFAGIERLGASVNSAAISARPLFATALAVGLLGEAASLSTLLGVVVLAAGLVSLALAEGGDISGWKRRHLLYPIAAAAFFGAGNVARRFGLEASPATALEAVALNETAAFVGLVAYTLAAGETDALRAPRKTYRYFAGSGTITAVALLALFAALAHPAGRVAVVDPLAATAPLFTVVFADWLLGDLESVTRGIVAGAALVVVGVALITSGPALVGF